jgi:SAM-dependent methyltransferase
VLAFHKGPRNLLIDLGSGHGLVARYMSKYFDKVIGTDPSVGMIQEARSRTNKEEYPNVDFIEASAESLPFAEDYSVDMVVAGQAAHWFDFAKVFAEMKRVLKRGGVMAFWGYGDQVMVNYPKATRMITEFYYRPDKRAMGPYWQQPGRSIVQGKLRAIQPPDEEWEVERVEYEPGTSGPHSGEGNIFMEQRMTVGQNMEYIRTSSSFHGWQEAHPDRKSKSSGGNGDCIDELFEEIAEVEDDWKNDQNWLEKEIALEWGTGLVLARKK